MKKRVFSLLLVCIMLLSLLPVSALAEEGDTPEPDQTVSTEQEADPIEDQSSNQLTDPDPEGEADTDLLSDGNAIVQEEDQIAPDSEEKEEDTAVEDTAPAAEPVRVVFVCEPTNLLLTVFAKSGTEKTIQPEGDGAYLLLPGEYFYTATAEGYVPAENIPFMVEASEEPLQFFVVLTAEQDETAMEPSSDDHEDGLESQMPEALSDDPEGETEPEVSETDPGDSEGELEPETPETPDVPENETPTEEGPEFHYVDSDESNTELFAKYVDQMFRNLGKERTRSMPTPDARLTAAGFAAEQAIKRMIQEVARGERTSTFFEIDISEYGYDLDDIEENDLDILVYVLMADCTNELYWFGHSWWGPWKSNDGKTICLGLCAGMPFRADPDDESTVDPSAIIRANTAVANAQAIINRYASSSDYDKLHGYKNEICRLNVYNYDAAEASNDHTIYYPNEVDNNPWELVYVFDNDPETNVVCEGYAKAFEYLCDHSSFRSRLINAYCVTGINHKWNIVTMNDGKNYLVDVTWCDDEYSETGNDEWFLRPWCGAEGAAPSFDSFYINVYDGYLSERSYDQETQCSYSAAALTLSETEYDPNAPDVYLRITTQPVDFEGHIGDTAVFTVAAEGDGLTYQWQWYNGSVWANSGITGNKTPTASTKITQTKLAYQYRCVITDENGNTVTSNAVRMILKQPIMITAQPVDFEGRIGDTAVFTVVAEGDGLTYQWQWHNGSVWANSGITGNKTPTASTKITQTKLSYQYRCVITDENGNTVTSNAVRMILRQPTVEIITQPVDYVGEIGDTAVFTVVAEGDGLTYQWQWFNGTEWVNSGITGNKTATASTKVTKTKLGYQYRCVITDEHGNVAVTDAVFIRREYTIITLNANGGFFNGDESLTELSFSLAWGEPLSSLPDYSVEHPEGIRNKFPRDLYSNPECTGDPIDWDYVPTFDMTFYVEWVQSASIVLHANGGRIDFGDGIFLDYMRSISYIGYEDTEFWSQEYLVTTDREFLGWYYEPECVNLAIAPGGPYVVTEPEVHLYAKWADVPGHMVTFHANGGLIEYRTYEETSFFVKEGNAIGFQIGVVHEDSHMEFNGWNLSADGSGQAVDVYSYVPTTDVTLYAQWEAAYAITLDANGGWFWQDTEQTSIIQNVRQGSYFENDWYWDVLYQADPHMGFDCWYLDAACTEPVPFDRNGRYYPTEDMTFYAGWAEGWIVTWDANGGIVGGNNEILTKVICKGNTAISWTIRKDGMAFGGWYTDPAFSEESRVEEMWSYIPTSDVTFYAKWVPGYTITFNANGGWFWENSKNTVECETIPQGDCVWSDWYSYGLKQADPHMAFERWYLDAACTEPVPFDEEGRYYPTGDITFYAGWIEGWIVTWDANGGTVGGEEILVRTIQKGNAIHDDWGVEKNGMAFDGWYTDPMFSEESRVDDTWSYVPTSDVTFYAKWVPGYTITLNANGGWFWDNSSHTIEYETIRQGDCFWRNWYSDSLHQADPHMAFDGWYLDAACTEPVPFNEDGQYYPTGDMTFYVKWGTAYIITLNANGGWFWNDQTAISRSIREGGYFWSDWYSGDLYHDDPHMAFDGWYLDAACTEPIPLVDGYCYPNGDMTIYAKWGTAYIITLNANGGWFWNGQTVISRSIREGDYFWSDWYSGDLYHDDPHMAFDGWYLDAACTEPVPFDQDSCYYPTEDMTIYAGWGEGWIVTWNANGGIVGGSGEILVRVIRKGHTAINWSIKRNGMVFDGWYTDPAFSDESRVEDMWSYIPTSDVTFYAKWSEGWTVTWDANGGRVGGNYEIRSTIIRKGEEVGINWSIEKEGMAFGGWYTDPAFSEESLVESVGSYVPTSDVTFYAKWLSIYTITLNANGGCFLGNPDNTVVVEQVNEGEGFWGYWYSENLYHADEQKDFAGWYMDAACTEPIPLVDGYCYPNGDMTIYAKWSTIYILTQPTNCWGEIGDTATFTVEASGEGLTYQWQWYNGSVWANSSITGNKTSTASTKITETKLAYQYRCVISDQNGDRVFTYPVRMLLIREANLGENVVQVSYGKEARFSFTPAYDGYYMIESIGSIDTVGYLYQGDDNIAYDDDDGENCNFRLIQYLEAGTKYWISVRTNSDRYVGELTFVIRDLFIMNQPENYQGKIGETATFRVEARGRGLTYQWQWYNGSVWANSGITGNKTSAASTKITEAKLAYQYRCKITDESGATIYSDPVRMVRILDAVLGENQVQVEGGKERLLTFTPEYSGYYLIESIGSLDTVGCLYQGDDFINENDDDGERNNFRLLEHLEAGTEYRIGVRTFGSNYSGMLTFIIRYFIIIEQPVDYLGDIGETAVFHVEAQGRGLTYQWQWYNGSVWANSGISGNKTATASTKITEAKLGYQYRCVITDENGATITSDAVRIVRMVKAVLGENQVQVADGNETMLAFTPEYSGYYRIESIGSIDTVGYLYQGDVNIAYDDDDGENCNFRLIQYLEAGTKYRIGVRTYSSGYTGELTFVISGFFISSQPQDYVGSIGDTATFHVEAEGEGLTYQWQWYNGTEWADSGISGNKTATASTKITQTKLGYQYRCVIKDALGNSIVSNAVRMIKSVSD